MVAGTYSPYQSGGHSISADRQPVIRIDRGRRVFPLVNCSGIDEIPFSAATNSQEQLRNAEKLSRFFAITSGGAIHQNHSIEAAYLRLLETVGNGLGPH